MRRRDRHVPGRIGCKMPEDTALTYSPRSRQSTTVLPPGEGLNGFLASKDYPPAVTGLTMAELLRRPPVRLAELDRLDPAPLGVGTEAREQAEIQAFYANTRT